MSPAIPDPQRTLSGVMTLREIITSVKAALIEIAEMEATSEGRILVQLSGEKEGWLKMAKELAVLRERVPESARISIWNDRKVT